VKSNFLFLVGLAGALGLSWAGIVLGSNAQLGGLAPYYDENDQASYPGWMAGQAARGQLVYRDLGCAACHTQQVRRPDFGSDQARGWGDRQSVARDYIYQPAPQLGSLRVGPDLGFLADHKPLAPDADDILHLLYKGAPGMPSYKFLFEKREIGAGAQPSAVALNLVGRDRPAPGWEVVPTTRAVALAAYLTNLKASYTFPEAVPVPPEKKEGEATPAPKPAAPAAPPAAMAAPVAKGAVPAVPASPLPSPTPQPMITPTPKATQ